MLIIFYALRNRCPMGRFFPKTTSVTKRRRRRSLYSKNAKRPAKPGANKRSILANTRLLSRIARVQRSHQVYTDYYMRSETQLINREWYCVPLVDPSNYIPTLRRNDDVLTEKATFIKRCVLNLQFFLSRTVPTITWNVFLVQMRTNYQNYDLLAMLSDPTWTNNYAYVRPNVLDRITLNSGYLKVLKHWYFTIQDNRFDSTMGIVSGYPASTYRRIQCSIPINCRIANNLDQNGVWPTLSALNIPHEKQVYLLMVPDSMTTTFTSDATYSTITTCMNTM